MSWNSIHEVCIWFVGVRPSSSFLLLSHNAKMKKKNTRCLTRPWNVILGSSAERIRAVVAAEWYHCTHISTIETMYISIYNYKNALFFLYIKTLCQLCLTAKKMDMFGSAFSDQLFRESSCEENLAV
jgi:hypothetical protein